MSHDQRDGKSIGRLPKGIGHTQWGVWSAIRSARLWQALLLSMDGEPRDWDKRGQELGEGFLERSEIAMLHIEAGTLPLLNRDRERPQESTVSLASFVKWAHGLGWELPNQFRAIAEREQPPRVSNAPKPITPVSGKGSAPRSRVEPARWDLWRLIPKCKLWQAVCLSLDLEPADNLAAQLRRGRTEYSPLPSEFWDRLKVCQANVRMAGPIRPQELYVGAADSPYVPVLLSDVAGFLASAQLPMPSAMRGLMPTEPAALDGDPQFPAGLAKPAESGASPATTHLIQNKAGDILDPAIRKAVEKAPRLGASEVFLALRELALSGEPPFNGQITDEGFLYTDARNEVRTFTQEALRKRLDRRRKAGR